MDCSFLDAISITHSTDTWLYLSDALFAGPEPEDSAGSGGVYAGGGGAA
jgi:hypothetical protein